MLEHLRAGWCIWGALSAAACPLLLHAQDAQYRPALQQLRNALDTTSTLPGVDGVAAQWSAANGNTTRRLGEAYIQLRHAVITQERNDLVSAWDDFDQVVTIHPDWPYARLGLAISGFLLYNRRFSTPAIYDGVSGGTQYDGVVIQLSRMLQAEPDFQPGIDWVATALAAEGDRAQQGPVLKALRLVADSGSSTNPQLQLVLARADRLEGRVPESLARLNGFLREGGDSGVAALEIARSLAAEDSLATGAARYLAGARVRTSAARDIYRLDLSWVATPRELATFDTLPTDSLANFVSHFWSRRDARELRPAGSRLEEHLRRWVFVNRNFRVEEPGRRTMLSRVQIPDPNAACRGGQRTLDDYTFITPTWQDYRSPERVFDHRAVIYMRHGEPLFQFSGDSAPVSMMATQRGNAALNTYDASMARQSQAGMSAASLQVAPGMQANQPFAQPSSINQLGSPQAQAGAMTTAGAGPRVPNSPITSAYTDRNVTWVYNIEGQFRAYTFLGHVALGTSHPSTLVVDRAPNLDVLLQLSSYSASYVKVANMLQANPETSGLIPVSCTRDYRQMVKEQQEGAALAVRTDSYLRTFSRPLTAMLQLAAIGQPTAGTGELLVAVGLRMEDLEELKNTDAPDKAAFMMRLQLAAIDTITGEAVVLDTTRGFLARRDQSGWMSFVTTLPLRPGLSEFRIAVAQGEERGILQSVAINPAPPGFSASDIVLGTEAGPASWRHDGGIVPVNPYSAYREDESVSIYQELYGLTVGASYRTTVSLRPVIRGKKRKERVALNFEDQAAGTTRASSRELSLDHVKPGLYDLVVEVEDVATGQRVQRDRSIAVYPRK